MDSSLSNEVTDSGINVDEERRMAWKLVIVVLLTLTLVKPLGPIPWIGTIAFTIAAALQLYLPVWRMDKLELDWNFLGLGFDRWRDDLRLVAKLCLISLPPYVIAHHLYMTELHGWVAGSGMEELAKFIPNRSYAPELPATWSESLTTLQWFVTMAATHLLGVALPEETFYRGYLQPRLEAVWKPTRQILGVPIGRAAVVAAALFAMGHFLGEWNPLRLGPFFPGLIFAWQRNATGSILGAITYHGLCNIVGELLFQLYQPIPH